MGRKFDSSWLVLPESPPRLSRERERQLLGWMHSESLDPAARRDARDLLITGHIAVVAFVLGKLQPPDRYREDLAGHLLMELVKAVDRFNPSRGVRLVNFLCRKLFSESKDYWRRRESLIHIPSEQLGGSNRNPAFAGDVARASCLVTRNFRATVEQEHFHAVSSHPEVDPCEDPSPRTRCTCRRVRAALETLPEIEAALLRSDFGIDRDVALDPPPDHYIRDHRRRAVEHARKALSVS